MTLLGLARPWRLIVLPHPRMLPRRALTTGWSSFPLRLPKSPLPEAFAPGHPLRRDPPPIQRGLSRPPAGGAGGLQWGAPEMPAQKDRLFFLRAIQFSLERTWRRGCSTLPFRKGGREGFG